MSESVEQPKSEAEPIAETIDSLVEKLSSSDGLKRQSARQELAFIGSPAIPALLKALQSPNERVRWEAAKALGEIRDPLAAPGLVQALEDEEPAVRWLAASALIALGRASLPSLLQALEGHSASVAMREGAHRVLHALIRDGRAPDAVPVLEALEDIEPAVEVPIAAYNVLQKIKQSQKEAEKSEKQ